MAYLELPELANPRTRTGERPNDVIPEPVPFCPETIFQCFILLVSYYIVEERLLLHFYSFEPHTLVGNEVKIDINCPDATVRSLRRERCDEPVLVKWLSLFDTDLLLLPKVLA